MKQFQIKLVLLCGVTSLLLTTGCANFSTLQTARALPEGQGRVLIGGGYYQSPAQAGTILEDVKAPYAEIGYRRGIVPNVEAGVKLTIPGTIALDGKYQLMDVDGFALAGGLGLGYLSLTTGTGTTETTTKMYDTIIPIYASYDINEFFSVYGSPKYMLRASSSTETSFSNIIGSSLGAKIGQDAGVMLEGSLMMGLGTEFVAYQFNGSVFF